MKYEEQRKLALKLFRGEKFVELRKAIKKGKCFQELLKIADQEEAIKLWDFFPDEWKFLTGKWKTVTDEMRIKAFTNLNDQTKCWAGKSWEGITDQMRIKAFP